MLGDGNFFFSQKIADGITVASFFEVFHVTLIDDFSSQTSGVGTDVNNIICCTNDFLVMFYNYYRVTELLQLAQHINQAVGVTAVQTDTGFVEDIEATYKTASQ